MKIFFNKIGNRIKRIITSQLLSKNPWCVPLSDQTETLFSNDPGYLQWLVKNKLTDNLFQLLAPARADEHPLFSIVMPVHNTPPDLLEKAVMSVVRQVYTHWELVICDDASSDHGTMSKLEDLLNRHAGIKVVSNKINSGISEATNRCVNNAVGDFIVFLDHDDELYPDALLKVKQYCEKYPDKKVFYSDEDFISPDGSRDRYNFKPGFSPSLLETHNYILHLVCVEKALFLTAGGLRTEFDGSQDYDLLLRLMDMKETFVHIPDVLYSWRESETSMIGGQYKPEIFERGKKALLDHYKRSGDAVHYVRDRHDDISGIYRTRFIVPEELSILLIKSDSRDLSFDCHDLPGKKKVTIVSQKDLGSMEDLLLLQGNYDIFFFLDSGVVPYLWQDFFVEMAGQALRSNSGVVGGLVLSRDLKMICAGMTMTGQNRLRYDYRGMDRQKANIHMRVCDRIAVPGTAMAVSSAALAQISCISVTDWGFFDTELCLGAFAAGLGNIFTPHAQAVVEECFADSCYSESFFKTIVSDRSIHTDPFLNPNLNPVSEQEMGFVPEFQNSAKRIKPSEETDTDEFSQWLKFYHKWLEKHSPDMGKSKERIEGLHFHPFFSIIIPTYNSPLNYFKDLIEAIKDQTYDRFEVCISDDGSDQVGFIDFLKEISQNDTRITVCFSEKNQGIAENTNQAIKMAKGDFIVFCDHDDQMELFALESLAVYIDTHPDTEVLYSDEDMMDEKGVRHSPRLQPEWNPDMLLSHMYCPHIVCFKKSLAEKTGPLHSSMDGAQDYDFFLRITERAKHIGHVPCILYSWRMVPGSVASDTSAKLYAYEAGRKAVESALARRSIKGSVIKANGTGLGVYRVKRKVMDRSVSHIIECKTGKSLEMIKSIKIISKIPVEIIAVIEEDNHSLHKRLKKFPEVRILTIPSKSVRPVFYNSGAAAAVSENLIFSGNDIEVLDSDYPSALLEHVQRHEIGAAGVKLIYPNGKYFHVGMLLGVNGVAGYAHRNTPQSSGYWNFAACIRNYSAVSWSFMGTSRKKWEEANGFDPGLNIFGDVDFCLKLVNKGYRNIYTPYVTGVIKRNIHFLEELRDSHEEKIMMDRHGEMIKNDPMYHPLLSRDLEDFSLLH